MMAANAARGGPPATVDVNLSTVEAVESILEDARVPVSRYFIRKRLGELGRSTTPARLSRVLEYLFRRKLAYEGSKGVQWTHADSPDLRSALAKGRRL